MDKDYYQILNISCTASQQEIKKAYLKLVKRFHPDRNPKDPESDEQTKSINEAYAVLRDRQKRRRYDRLHGPHNSGTVEEPFFQHLHAMMFFKKNQRALKNYVHHAFNRGNYSLAGSLLEQGIRLSPEDHELYMGLSWCLFHQGHYDRCARVLEKSLALNPKNVDAWFNLAWLQENGGDLSGALRSMRRAAEYFPDLSELKNRIAELERKMDSSATS
jgi:curved DNA-binding protein CbpA